MTTKYPDFWPCQLCNRPFNVHLKEGMKAQEASKYTHTIETVINTKNWCFKGLNPRIESYNWYYRPVDNLTMVEKLAEQKDITGNKQ